MRLRRELSAVSASGTSSQEVTAEIADLQRRIERQIANLEAENTTPALRRRITARIAELEEAVEDRRQRATVLCITRTPSCMELADPSNAKRSDADERPDSRGAEVLEGPSVGDAPVRPGENSAEVSSVLLLAVAQWRTLDFRLAAALGTTMARPGHTGERCDRHRRVPWRDHGHRDRPHARDPSGQVGDRLPKWVGSAIPTDRR